MIMVVGWVDVEEVEQAALGWPWGSCGCGIPVAGPW